MMLRGQVCEERRNEELKIEVSFVRQSLNV